MEEGLTGGDIELRITNAAGTLIKVEGLLTCSPPNPSSSVADSTDQESDSSEEFIVTNINPGEISGTHKYIAGNATDIAFREHLISREVRPFLVQEPTEVAIYDLMSEQGYGAVTDYQPDSGETAGVRTSSFTIKVSGVGARGELDSKGNIIPFDLNQGPPPPPPGA